MTIVDLEGFIQLGQGESILALDCETTGLHPWKDSLIGVGIWAPNKNRGGYLPFSYPQSDSDRQVLTELRRFLARKGWADCNYLVGHNFKFDLHFLQINPRGVYKILDSIVMAYLDNEDQLKSLGECAKKYLKDNTKATLMSNFKTKQTALWTEPVEAVAIYCINDCRLSYELAQHLWTRLQNQGLLDLLGWVMDYEVLLYEVEERGFLIDPEMVEQKRQFISQKKKGLEQQLFKGVGKVFNWHSHQQLAKALYEDLKIPRPQPPPGSESKPWGRRIYTETCTSGIILAEKVKHPLGQVVLLLREADRLLGTLDKWVDQQVNNYLHTDFNLAITKTGRLSSSKPNLQNVATQHRLNIGSGFIGDIEPEREEELLLRNVFVARPGYKFVSIDYKQMEIRMFTLLSDEKRMMQWLHENRDIHGSVAEAVWKSKDPNHREMAKTISFGLIYGASVGSLVNRLSITYAEAKKLSDRYLNEFPRIKAWTQEIRQQMDRDQYVTYWSSRRWRERRPNYYYRAVNALIQGGSADLLMVATLRCRDYLQQALGGNRIINSVHDELIFEIEEDLLTSTIPTLRKTMEVPDLLGLPFITDCKIGERWGSLRNWAG